MTFAFDHDLHIHSSVSPYGGDPAQTPERILRYAADNGLKTICLTDHYWDGTAPAPYGTGAGVPAAKLKSVLPLPQREGIRFLFGAETDMDRDLTVGVGPDMAKELDFVL